MDLDAAIARMKDSPETSGVLCDFDGTLAPIVAEPAAAAAAAGASEALEGLAGAYRLVAVVSGRRAEDVAKRAGAGGVLYCGLYGAEVLAAGELGHPAEASAWAQGAAALAAEAEEVIGRHGLEGWWVENKHLAVSVHFRASGLDAVPARMDAWAREAAPRHGFHSSAGRMVIEFRPAAVSKAATAARLVAEHGLERVLMAGDDAADVEAFVRLRDLLGEEAVTVGVASPEEPVGMRGAASAMVQGPDEVVALLRKLVP